MTAPQAPRQTLDKWIMLNKGASAAIVLAVVGVLAVVLSIAVSGGARGPPTAHLPAVAVRHRYSRQLPRSHIFSRPISVVMKPSTATTGLMGLLLSAWCIFSRTLTRRVRRETAPRTELQTA
jgi:hypothetical protein